MSNIYAELRDQKLQIQSLQYKRKTDVRFVEQLEFVIAQLKTHAELASNNLKEGTVEGKQKATRQLDTLLNLAQRGLDNIDKALPGIKEGVE